MMSMMTLRGKGTKYFVVCFLRNLHSAKCVRRNTSTFFNLTAKHTFIVAIEVCMTMCMIHYEKNVAPVLLPTITTQIGPEQS